MFPRTPPPALLVHTRADPREDLALDGALLRDCDARGDAPPRGGVLRIWERPAPCVVLGRANRAARNVDAAACAAGGVPVLRRGSGGGTVLLGPGAICWSLVLPVGPPAGVPGDIPAVTAAIMHRLAAAFRDAGVPAGVDGTSDLTVRGQNGNRVKVGGNAQRWLQRAMLHHGTLLYDFDLSLIPRYLSPPERQPEYRAGRPHAAFVTNLPLPRAAVLDALTAALGAGGERADPPLALMRESMAERYARPDWHAKR